jgi:hypothetical protein
MYREQIQARLAIFLVYKYGQRPAEVGMKTRNKERYKELSEHAEVEDDSQKLRKIAKEINRILKAEINRLKKDPSHSSEELR